MRLIRCLASLSLLAAAAGAAPPPKIRALIFSGRNNHDWRASTPFLRDVLVRTGLFDVRVVEEPAGAGPATLEGYDVLVLDYCGARWGATAEQAVESFVKSGKGMVVVHAASYPFGTAEVLGDDPLRGKTQPPWMEYRKMVGAWWERKQEPITGHGDRHSFKVKFTERAHPIAAGMNESFVATDELYRGFRMMPGVRVFATAFDDPKYRGSGKDEPMLWTLEYGKGRVFHTALGHNLAALQETGFVTTFARGAEWAAAGRVTLPARIDPFEKNPKAVRLLAVTGGHSYDTSFYTMFEGGDEISWEHATSIRQAFSKDARPEIDAVLLYNMDQERDDATRRNLRSYLESGKGLVVLHHAIADFNDWEWWYRDVVGGKYLLKAEGATPGSTYKHDQEIFVETTGRHPITGDVGPLHVWDEVYKGMWISPEVQVLMKTNHPDADPPLAWVSPYSKSRVACILLGHDRLAHLHAGFRTLVRNAVLWSAGRK